MFTANPSLLVYLEQFVNIIGRGESTNAAVVASHNQSKAGWGPALGRAVETNETRITAIHTIDDDMKGKNAEDISGFEEYKKV